VDFKLYTNALKAYTADNGDLHVRGTTSSTIVDMHGDEMTLAALKSMEETAKQNMTVFLNHNYNVPDDLFGSVTDARIVKRYDQELGTEVYDLDIDVRVVGEDENPLAMKTYRAIKRGVKLGLSIGARVEKVAKRKANDGKETYVIDSVRLLESSVVGIPANQRSYLQSALKSLRSPGVGESLEKAAADGVKEGDFVSWDSSGGAARGRVEHVMREGTLGIPDSDFKINATPEDPAALIRIWSKSGDGWAETDKLVGHKFSTLRKIESLKAFGDLVVKAVELEGQPAPERAALIESLQDLLADSTAFYLKAHGAHWNVVGEDFTEYHVLFEEIYKDVQEAIDPTAELLRKMNAPTLADISEYAARANGEPVADDNDPESLAEAVYAANETVLDCIIRAINEAAKLNQQGVLNFLAERQDMHQKWSWQLRASLAPEENEPEPAETPEAPGDMPEVEDSLKAASKIEMGNYVSWKQVEGADGVGEVEQVVKDGEVTVPSKGDTVASKPNDPAVLVRVWNPENGGYKPSNEFMGFNASQLTIVPDLGKGGKKPDATTVPGLEITNPQEEKKSMEDLEQKKTRVTVTVSTEGDGAAVATQPAPAAEPEDTEEVASEAVTASAEKDCDCAEGACACEGEIVEKAFESAPAATPAPAPAPAPAPEPEPAPVVDPKPADAPKASEGEENKSPRYKSGVSDQVLSGINGILADLTDEDRDAVLSGLGVQKDGEPEVAPISDSTAAVEVAEDVAPAAEEVAVEVAPAEVEAVPAEGESTTSLEEVAAIAKSALDAAIAAQQEVVSFKKELTELAADKAKVEGELAKALDIVGRMINVPMGRKHVAVETTKSTNGEKAPWLDPFIARLLDAQE
jgi:starvation-inducible DNA-binding protein